VELFGLTINTELNGKTGRIASVIKDGYSVEMDSQVMMKHQMRKVVTFFGANLRKVGEGEAAKHGVDSETNSTESRTALLKQNVEERGDEKVVKGDSKKADREEKRNLKEHAKVKKKHRHQMALLNLTHKKVPKSEYYQFWTDSINFSRADGVH
jgi:hypothetical protein